MLQLRHQTPLLLLLLIRQDQVVPGGGEARPGLRLREDVGDAAVDGVADPCLRHVGHGGGGLAPVPGSHLGEQLGGVAGAGRELRRAVLGVEVEREAANTHSAAHLRRRNLHAPQSDPAVTPAPEDAIYDGDAADAGGCATVSRAVKR